MTRRPALRSLACAAAVAAGSFGLAAGASAGSCPADQIAMAGEGQKPGATENAAVTDTVLTKIDLANEALKIPDRQFRMRRLVVQPGGTVAWHSHADRPAIIYIVSGEMTEYASTCKQPIVHKAGETSTEQLGTEHWWKNTGDSESVLLSADLLHAVGDPNTM